MVLRTVKGAAGQDPPQRPVTIDDLLRPLRWPRRDLRRLPRLLWQAIGMVWEAAPRQFLLGTALQLAGGLSLAAQLFVGKSLLEKLLGPGPPPPIAAMLPDLVLFSALLFVVWLSALGRAEQQRLMGHLVQRHTTQRVMNISMSVPLLMYDQPEYYDRLQRARVSASVRPAEIVDGLLNVLQGGLAVAAVGTALLWIEPLILALVAVGYLPTWYLSRVGARLLYRHNVEHTAGDRRRAYLYLITTRKEEAHEVRAFGSRHYLQAAHDAVYDAKIRDLRRVIGKRLLLGFLGGVVSVAVTGVALGLLVVFVATGRLDVATAGTAVAALIIIAGRLRNIANGAAALYEGSLFLEDFTSFLKEYQPQHASSGSQYAAKRAANPVFGEIELDHVGFNYPARLEPALRDISLRIRRGEIIALVGENGSGKTTLAKLLAGLYSPAVGHVRWDGVDLTELDLDSVRNQVALIFQDFAHYFLAARENVGIAQPSSMHDRDAIEQAAAQAGAHDFLSSLPNGYESILGPEFIGGSDLSGGQWQRVALARAYFRHAPLLILDEPTASLDPRAELEVFERVRRLAHGRTVVLISHRFSSARTSDRILVMHQGRILEEGPHEALMAHGGLYAELFSLQAKSYSEPIHGAGRRREGQY